MTYPDPSSKSQALTRRAQRVLPDGGSRSTIRLIPHAIFAQQAQGKYVTDVDGNRLLDFSNNYTSLIHGHAHPHIVAAVQRQLTQGTAWSFGSESEIQLAELLCARVPSFAKIRFCNSGTEAVMLALKAARAFTGKPKIAKVERAYHGTYDYAEVSLAVPATDLSKGDPTSHAHAIGTPPAVLADTVVIPFNQPQATERILQAHAHELAAVLVDPFGLGLGRVPPTRAFMDTLVRFCREHPALLIFDEVVAFRAGYQGAQGVWGIQPDLTALGKIMGGGFPVGAVAGRAEAMQVFEVRNGRAALPHGGTFNANPITMHAGLAAMELMTAQEFARLNELGERFRQGLTAAVANTNLDIRISGQASVFAIDLRATDFTNRYLVSDELTAADHLRAYLFDQGIFLSSGLHGCLSTVMDDSDIAPLCDALLESVRRLKG